VFHGQESEKSLKKEDQESRKKIQLRLLLQLTHFQAAGLDPFDPMACNVSHPVQ